MLTTSHSAQELRDILSQLESAATDAGAKLVVAEALHHASLRTAVTDSTHSTTLTEASLADAIEPMPEPQQADAQQDDAS
jgi:hypothetical protein